MLRIQKKYILNYHLSLKHKQRIPGYEMSFSSYPAFVQSTDDFYIISSGNMQLNITYYLYGRIPHFMYIFSYYTFFSYVILFL